ncbi:MAG TPA: PQQ-dependent sugar dehydrogenase [Pyrinomonadaceae bacterium]|nr:PQQ-dependent sugar dehydrogenase [Pyrinomonadaceae bacterium]
MHHQFLPKVLAALLILFGFVEWTTSVTAATLPAGFSETQISGLTSPTAMEIAPDGRIFVCQQTGGLRVIKNGALLSTPFLTLSVDSSGERGLLGVTFDPNFATNNFIYVYYTVSTSPKHNRLSRFTANGDLVVPGSEQVLLELDNLTNATNHNGGAIHFGPDGKLYIAVGENATSSNSQTLSNLLGKVLRLNADGSIPADNPFFNTATGKNRAIWALGLRNPFTFAFQPGSGRLFINDVGESTWEEINDGIAGSNYGWPITEGPTNNPSFRSPLFSYGHGTGSATGCAIAGGAFYNPTTNQFPASYVGKYFFADLCSGWIRLFDPATSTASAFASGISLPVDLKVSPDGSLYYLSIGSGSVFRVQFTATGPSITSHPANQTVALGQTATFTVSATGTAPLSYQWQKNQTDIAGANASSYTTPPTSLTDNGSKFRCVVSNGFGNAPSNEATLSVTLPPPQLLTEENGDLAIALDSVLMVRDPFAVVNILNFSLDQRTRVMFFSSNTDLLAGENSSAVTARAEDAQLNIYPLNVEFVGKVPGFDWLSQVIVKLPDNLPVNQNLFVSITLRGQTSNKARMRVK